MGPLRRRGKWVVPVIGRPWSRRGTASSAYLAISRGADTNRVNALITLVASVATAVVVLLADSAWHMASERPKDLIMFAGLAVALQAAAVDIYGRGAISFSGMGILATGFALGPSAGMVAAVLVAIINVFIQQTRLDRAAFNAGKLLQKSGRIKEAIGRFRTVVAIEPTFGTGHLYLAQALLEDGDLAGAEQSARPGLQNKPEPRLAPLGHYVLADLYNRTGRHAEARRQAQIGRQLEAESRARAAGNRRAAAASRRGPA